MGSSLSCCCKDQDKALCEIDNNEININCCQKSNNKKGKNKKEKNKNKNQVYLK